MYYGTKHVSFHHWRKSGIGPLKEMQVQNEKKQYNFIVMIRKSELSSCFSVLFKTTKVSFFNVLCLFAIWK